ATGLSAGTSGSRSASRSRSGAVPVASGTSGGDKSSTGAASARYRGISIRDEPASAAGRPNAQACRFARNLLRMTRMKDKIAHYLDAYVAARRTERQITRQEIAWDRWVARVRLAHTLGYERLAAAARQRALLHSEAAAW